MSKVSEHYIAVWDITGLECLVSISSEMKRKDDWEKACTYARLMDTKLPDRPVLFNLEHAKLRAKYNGHRHYEIYAFCVDADITHEQIFQMFYDNPQFIVDLIRKSGVQLYSDRVNTRTQKIV